MVRLVVGLLVFLWDSSRHIIPTSSCVVVRPNSINLQKFHHSSCDLLDTDYLDDGLSIR